MRVAARFAWVVVGCTLLFGARGAAAQDWPQWRGPNRDGKTTAFKAPATWPAALTKKWDIAVGSGVSNPSLVGDRLYVIAREGEDEVLRCMNATTGEDVWKKTYQAAPATGFGAGNGRFVGPRSTPTVANGRVLTISVSGLLSCFDAANGELKWQKDEFVGQVPDFFTSSSPIVVDGLCIAQLGRGSAPRGGRGRRGGGEEGGAPAQPPALGAMIAYDLTTGDEKWRVPAGSPSYGSPVTMTVDGMKVVVAITETNVVAVNTADGKSVWQLPYRQGTYNSASPVVDGQTLIIAGPGSGMTALKMSKVGDTLKEEESWKNPDNNLIFNTPVLKDGALFAISTNDEIFAVKPDHATGWATSIAPPPAGRGAGAGALVPGPQQTVFAQQPAEGRGGGEAGRGEAGRGGEGRGAGRGEGRGRGRGRGRNVGGGERPGYGTVVDAGSVMIALSPGADFVVFKPSAAEYTEIARYKVSTDGDCYSHPILSGNRIYIKDKDSVSMWVAE